MYLNELVKEVTKTVTKAVKHEVRPKNVKNETITQRDMDYGAFSDDGAEQGCEEAFHQENNRRLRNSYQSRKDGKVEQIFAKLLREARYLTGP